MKKLLIILVLSVVLTPVAKAQPDTVQWKYKNYHYSLWYDTLPEFYTYYLQEWRPALKVWKWLSLELLPKMTAMPQRVERPTPVYGVAVTELMDYGRLSLITRNDWYIEEYMYLFQKVGDTMVLLDSARWDTVTPKVMKLAMNADTMRYGFGLVKVYEALFEKPVTVDSVFYIVSSNNGGSAHCGSGYYEYEYRPVVPVIVGHLFGLFQPQWCPKPAWWEPKAFDFQTREWSESAQRYNSPIFGMYFPIVDYVELIVESADTAMGTAGPVAHVPRNTTQTIYAEPKPGYGFSHWREGGSNPTRSVYVAQDTTRFTAIFRPLERYRVECESEVELAGYVEGGGMYYEGDTAVLEAHAAEGYVFDRWSTGATANPLRIVVESDTVVTAYFVPATGIASVKGGGAAFAVSPNPAHGEVSVTLTEASERGAELRLHDAAGREVLRRELSAGTRRATLEVSGLPAGTYFVTLTTAVGTGTRRLVID